MIFEGGDGARQRVASGADYGLSDQIVRISAPTGHAIDTAMVARLSGSAMCSIRLDATVEKVRHGGRLRCMCLVVAHGGQETGRREIRAVRFRPP